MGQRLQISAIEAATRRALARCWLLFGVLVLLLGGTGCSKLLGGPFDKVFIVDDGAGDGGIAGTVAASCITRNAECGEFFDEALGVTFQCGGCASNERCVANRCVCDTVSCEELSAECGYQNNGCSQLTSCGKCEDVYAGDPEKAFCNTEGKCGPAPVLPTTCEEVRALGQAADCGIVGIGETTLDCGTCPGREQCINNSCEGYEPLTCDELTGGGSLCGTFPNGAGGEITCACGPDERCAAGNVCCTPRTVCPTDGCGIMSDGCGGKIDCGGCDGGETCLANVCCGATPQCPVGACGPQVSVCGQLLDCGCGAGECCVGDEDGSGFCHMPSCPTDGSCGDGLDDGCGGTADGCGCPDGHVCNAEQQCECVPRECPIDGSECGVLDDGCGGQINCFVCPQEGQQTCYENACCAPSCPTDGSCGTVSNGCGGLKTCGCADGETCIEGKCATPECPAGSDCGINLVGGVALSCRGECEDGQTCAERGDGVYACGDCSATCPTDAACGLVDVGCTILSCDGACGLDTQSCVNRKVGDGPDNFNCCTPSCPNVSEATCGDNVDPQCGGQTASCPGMCPTGERCVLGDDGEYGCVVPECPSNPTCGENPAVPEGTIQCDGSCEGANEMCAQSGSAFTCECNVPVGICGNSCDTTISDVCGEDIPCTCSTGEVCADGSCCRPAAARAVCEQANAECGTVIDPTCEIEVECGPCTAEQTCTDNQCLCDPTKCEANESCDSATQACKCDSSKCPSGQSCTAQGTCTCDSSKCPDGKVCNAQGMCACPQTTQEACAGAVCGMVENECGEMVSCGNCGANRTCDDGQCVCNESNAEACAGIACGSTTNDCMEPVSCPNTCDAVLEQCSGNQCACKELTSAACQRLGHECGPGTNNCGDAITCPNTCDNDEHCTGNSCVCNQTPPQACEAQNLCGDVTGLGKVDNCGGALTSCGDCDSPDYECGVDHTCVCAETVTEACNRQNLCGPLSAGSYTDQCDGVLTNCGECAANEECENSQCVAVCVEATCGSRVCGTIASVCGGQPIPCGTCDGGTCAPDGSACIVDPPVGGDGGP